MLEVGRVCVKTAGRTASSICVVVDLIDKNFVLVDGNIKRKKCNIMHLEPLPKKLEISKGADTSEVLSALNKAGFKLNQKRERKQKQIKEDKDEPRKKQKK